MSLHDGDAYQLMRMVSGDAADSPAATVTGRFASNAPSAFLPTAMTIVPGLSLHLGSGKALNMLVL